MTLGQNLQAARKAKGLSQETLAEQIGVSRQALGKWEKDIALPGLDNLQAAAQVLGVSVDTLLGTEAAGPAPAVTLDAMRDLLAARDAEQRKHRRLWGLLGAAAAVVVVLLLVVQNLAYQRKMQNLTDSYAMLQSQLSSTTADLSTRMDELQDAVRQGKSTVLEWRWVPVDKLHRDVQSSWMPVLVQVTPSESTTGMTARLSVTYGDTTELHDMGVLAGDIYQAQLVFTVGQTYDLTIEWTAADGAADGTAFVFMGHGTSHTAKVSYSQMQTTMETLGYDNVFIGTVEGEPEDTACEAVIEKVKEAGYTKVVLRPLMVVAGDHANNDMAGADEDSWLSQFNAAGCFDSVDTQIAGLGEIADIQQIYVNHTKAAMDALNG